jgi:TolB-like protein
LPIEAPEEVAFGPFRLDHRNRRLTKAGVAVPLGGRAIDVLSVLVAAAVGETVSKDTLLERAWPGVTVDENNVQVQISALRKALGENWIITEPGHGYRLAQHVAASIPLSPLVLPDKPSLVVLPFQNMSGDPEQDYFVDGLVEDITTSLCCIRSLFVIARNSAFSYRGQAVDVRRVGRELGVRYVMEGSVRRVGNRVRIAGQLVDATTGVHIWADRFDDALDDVFQLQGRIAERVAGAIEPTLQRAEIERVQRKAPQDLAAYDYYLRGLARLHEGSGEAARAAYSLFIKACELDPAYGAAYGLAAFSAGRMKSSGLLDVSAPEIAEGVRLAWLAVQHGRDDPTALCYAALPLSVLGLNPQAGAGVIDRACVLNPNSAMAWYVSGATRNFLGETASAIANFERAMRLSPIDPLLHQFLGGLALALNLQGRHEDAVAVAERAVIEQPNHVSTRRHLVASYALAGRLDQARHSVDVLLRMAPHTRISRMADWSGPLTPAYLARLADAYRLAGMPE